jgi:uncharacterized protein (DUF302 family)
MALGLSTTLRTSFDDAVQRTTQALADQGFGVLTTIDVKATLKEKLGEDMADYTILGACNPSLAHRALTADPQVGQLLPCNVVVRSDPADGDTVFVEAMDPQVMAHVASKPEELAPFADEVTAQLQVAIRALGQT